jgi:hypothetical protein
MSSDISSNPHHTRPSQIPTLQQNCKPKIFKNRNTKFEKSINFSQIKPLEQGKTDSEKRIEFLGKLASKNFTYLKEFNPYHCPPDIKRAEIHSQANRVGKLQPHGLAGPDLDKICQCCGLTANITPLPLCTPDVELSFLGSTVVLYFEFLKKVGLLMILAVIFGLINSIRNSARAKCGTYDSFTLKCTSSDWTDSVSVANYGADWDDTGKILTLVLSILFC